LSEFFSASAHMVSLQKSEDVIMDQVQKYLHKETQRLNKIRDMLQQAMQAERPEGNSSDVLHPINAYHLINRWHRVLDTVVEKTPEFELKSSMERNGLPFLKSDDMTGVKAAILRLQRVYNLSSDDLARGDIHGEYAAPFTAEDMAELGRSAMNTGDYGLAVEWMEKAVGAVPLDHAHSRWVLDLARATFFVGDTRNAIKFANIAYNLAPDDKSIEGYLKSYKDQLLRDEADTTKNVPKYTQWRRITHPTKLHYEALCRDKTGTYAAQFRRGLEFQQQEFCRWRATSIPYLRYCEEVYNTEPMVSVIYDVFSDGEIEQIKLETAPRLSRASVGDPSKIIASNERVGKTSWLWDTQMQGFVEKLSKRIALITGFSTTWGNTLTHAEPWQIGNYGIAGQYEPHYDYYENEDLMNRLPNYLMNTGDRMATLMVYLSSVVAGGDTVFPNLNLRLPAIKGSAVLWYNIKRSGVKDSRMIHAGCPVLLGEKWIANKWIRERGQEFRRPCGLSYNTTDEFWGAYAT